MGGLSKCYFLSTFKFNSIKPHGGLFEGRGGEGAFCKQLALTWGLIRGDLIEERGLNRGFMVLNTLITFQSNYHLRNNLPYVTSFFPSSTANMPSGLLYADFPRFCGAVTPLPNPSPLVTTGLMMISSLTINVCYRPVAKKLWQIFFEFF